MFNMPIYLIPTKNAEHLADILSEQEELVILRPLKNKDNERRFPDGEIYMRLAIDNPSSQFVVLHSGMPDPNEGVVELEMILQILRREQAEHVTVVFSYFPFGMQDMIFEKGETNVAEDLVKKIVNYYGVKKVFVLDAHFFGKPWVENLPIINIPAAQYIAGKIRADKEIIFLSPDAGGKARTGLKGFKKNRNNSYDVDIEEDGSIDGNFEGETICVIDDIIETGGTLSCIGDRCRQYGAKKIIAVVTHGVLACGIERIKNCFDEVYLTNSIANNSDNIVDISGLLMEYINKENKAL